VEERNRLIQLVKLQAKEVDALKAEINMLRRKGGHIYTPAVRPPMPPDQLAQQQQQQFNDGGEMPMDAQGGEGVPFGL
jgi:hypothetical protein